MNTYNSLMSKIQNEASARFNSFSGQKSYSNAVGAGQIDPNNRTITLQIALSTTASTGAVRLFGYVWNPSTTYNTANNTTVTVQEYNSDDTALKLQAYNNPFRIQGMKMFVTDSNQFANTFSITRKSPQGEVNTKVYHPSNAQNPQNFSSTQILDDTFQVAVDGYTYIDFNVNAKESITLVLYIVDMVSTESILNSNPVLKQSDTGMPTGLVAQELVVRDGSSNFYGRRY